MHTVREWRTTVFTANTKHNKSLIQHILYITKHIYNKKYTSNNTIQITYTIKNTHCIKNKSHILYKTKYTT